MDGLLHVSEMANYRVANVRDELKEGEQVEVEVKVINSDPSGGARLRRKVLLNEGEGTSPKYVWCADASCRRQLDISYGRIRPHDSVGVVGISRREPVTCLEFFGPAEA